MAHFYGEVEGNRQPVHRLGTAASGLSVTAASWQGAVRTTLYERDGVDYATVRLVPWHGAGVYRVLYDGPVRGVEAGGGRPLTGEVAHAPAA